jgi:uncharacterized protein YllA (UPF0747 family)
MEQLSKQTRLLSKGKVTDETISTIKNYYKIINRNYLVINDFRFILNKSQKYIQEKIVKQLVDNGILRIEIPNGCKQQSCYYLVKR